jgi:hypothetical protein
MQPSFEPERRKEARSPLRFPVSVKLANAEMSVRSENISVSGILLSSDFLIPEGSVVELAVRVARASETGFVLTARGKVLRLQPQPSGEFAIAVACDHPFRIARQNYPRSRR